jgi:hypothetical protein
MTLEGILESAIGQVLALAAVCVAYAVVYTVNALRELRQIQLERRREKARGGNT